MRRRTGNLGAASVWRNNALPLLFIALFSSLLLADIRPGMAGTEKPGGPVASDTTPVQESTAVSEDAPADESTGGETTATEPDTASTDAEASDSTEVADDQPLMEWYGESPHWVPGQEFSAVKDAPFIGSYECTLCHETLKEGFLHTAHARNLRDRKIGADQQGCEMCHGAGGAHAVLRSRGLIFAFDWKDPKATNSICLRCHTWLTSDHEWGRTTHAKAGLTCIQCHDPHVPASNRWRFLLLEQQDRQCVTCHKDAGHDFSRFSHHPVNLDTASDPSAPAMHCTDCHDVHAGHERSMLPTRRVSDTCATCHADKAGPFRFEHMATQEGIGQGCLQCHAQHGSSSPDLLTADGRALCLQCHTDRDTHYQPLTCYTSGCHSDIHGSNKNLLLIPEP